MTLTVAIITDKLELDPLLLKSLSFADEIVIVVDSPSVIPGSTRNPAPTKSFLHPLNGDFSAQRNFALQKAKSDWVFFIDDDEYIGTELAQEIEEKLKDPQYLGFFIPRLDVVFHQPLLHGETGNLIILRLGQRSAGRFIRSVHETWKISGRVGELQSPLYHLKDHFVSEFSGRMSEYGKIDGKILDREGKPFSLFRLFIYPLAKFKLNYFLKAGFLDGLPGLFLAYLMSVQSLTTRVFQWENQK